MGISDRLLGKKTRTAIRTSRLSRRQRALPGGEVRIFGKALRPAELRRPRVQFGSLDGSVVISSDEFLVARVPPGRCFRPHCGFDQWPFQQPSQS